jgi:hypothetical protein
VTNGSDVRDTAEKVPHASSDMGGFEDKQSSQVDAVNDTVIEEC